MGIIGCDVLVEDCAGRRCMLGCRDMGGGGTLVREMLRARAFEEERGGTLPGGMLYILDRLCSPGLGGDGVLEASRPRVVDLMPFRSAS